MSDHPKDLLGQPMTDAERELLEIHQRLIAMASDADLPPVVLMNARQAAVSTWNACKGLLITDEKPNWD